MSNNPPRRAGIEDDRAGSSQPRSARSSRRLNVDAAAAATDAAEPVLGHSPRAAPAGGHVRSPLLRHASPVGDDSARPDVTTQSQRGRTNRDGEDSATRRRQGSPAPRRGRESNISQQEPQILPSLDIAGPYYEPLGELIQQDREQGAAKTDFTIPQPLQAPASPGSSGGGGDGFAIPRRPSSTLAGSKRKATTSNPEQTSSLPRVAEQRRQSVVRMADPAEESPSPIDRRSPSTAAGASAVRTCSSTMASSSESSTTATAGEPSTARPRRSVTEPAPPASTLPTRKVFPIQIGDKLFRLSGASIASDAPSYFSQFFEEQVRLNEGADKVRTLYIDRDPATFEDIAKHLQGYHVEPRDGPHFVKLFADAQFFSLPRLTAQLFSSTIYIRIGDAEFQIPRDLFNNPGDSPNYFSLGFSIFFGTPTDAFPGLAQRSLLRPPSILPPSVPNRSAKTFADILHFLKGYPVEIRSEEHRQELLRDVRYFHLKGLEQRIITHHISYNLVRQQSEIVIRLDDIRQSGISFVADSERMSQQAPAAGAATAAQQSGWVLYQRPYVDSEAHSLIVEIGGEESTFLSVEPARRNAVARLGRATFRRQALTRFTSLLTVVANKMALPVTQPLGLMMTERGGGVGSLPANPSNTGLSEERVKVRLSADADVVVDGRPWEPWSGESDDEDDGGNGTSMDVDPSGAAGSTRRGGRRGTRARQDDDDEGEEWVLKRAQWRLRVQPVAGGAQAGRSGVEVILGAVKIEAYSNERGRNTARGFLP